MCHENRRGPKIRNIETEPRIATRFAPVAIEGGRGADGTRWEGSEGKGVPSHPLSAPSAGNSSGSLDQDPANLPCDGWTGQTRELVCALPIDNVAIWQTGTRPWLTAEPHQ